MRGTLALLIIAVLATSAATAGADEAVPSLLAEGRVDEAIAALHGQIKASPDDALAHNLLCRAYFSLGQWDRGISDGEKADQAAFMTGAGLARRVRTEFEAAVHLNPKSVDARSDLAEFYLEAPGIVGGGRDKAEQQANSLFSLDRARAHWVNARLAEKKKDFTAAEKEYRAAIEASHSSASAWLNLGLFYRHRERFDEMVQALDQVRSAPLDRPDALVDAADILIRSQRQLPEAVQLLRTYLSSSTKVEQAPAFKVHYLLGTAIEKLGDKQNAAAEYRSALGLAKEFQPA